MIFHKESKYKFFIPLLFFLIFTKAIILGSSAKFPDSTSAQNKNHALLLSNVGRIRVDSYPDFILSNIPQNDSIIKLNVFHRNLYSNNINNRQTDSLSNTYIPKWYSMITNLPLDMVSFYKEDITFKEIPLYLGIAASTAGLIATDNQTWKASDKFYHSSSFNKTASNIFEYVGDGRSQLGLAVSFALFGFFTKDNRALTTASEIVEAVLASGAVVQLLKHVTGRESPFVSTKPAGAWRPFPNQIDYLKHVPAYDAFPSGHLTTSLAAFVVIAENYPEYKWIRPVSYVTEGLLAISMVNKGIHWYSDYPLAIFLGYEFGNIIAHHDNSFSSQNDDNKKSKIVIGPSFNYLGTGLSVSFEF